MKWPAFFAPAIALTLLAGCGQAPTMLNAPAATSQVAAREANPFAKHTVAAVTRTRFSDDYQLVAARFEKDRWGKPSQHDTALVIATVKGSDVTFKHVALKGGFMTHTQRLQFAQMLAQAKVDHLPEVVSAIAKGLATQYPGKAESVELALSKEVTGYVADHLEGVQKAHPGQAISAEVTAKVSRDVFHTVHEGKAVIKGAPKGQLTIPMQAPRGETAYYVEVRVTVEGARSTTLPVHHISNFGKNFKGTLTAK